MKDFKKEVNAIKNLEEIKNLPESERKEVEKQIEDTYIENVKKDEKHPFTATIRSISNYTQYNRK